MADNVVSDMLFVGCARFYPVIKLFVSLTLVIKLCDVTFVLKDQIYIDIGVCICVHMYVTQAI